MNFLKNIYFIFLYIITLSSLIYGQNDVAGSKDHTLISRYPNSIIKWFDQQEFDSYKIAIGPVTGYRNIDDWLNIEGKVTRIFYTLSGSRSVVEVYLNYEKALKKNGFEIIVQGLNKNRNVGKDIGGKSWLGVHFGQNSLPPSVPLLQGSSSTGGSGFIAAKLTRNNATIYAVISLLQHSADQVFYQIDIIEEKPVEDDFIFINAELMRSEIQANGRIALYGIYFDTDKSTIKTESKSTFEEIKTFLTNNPELNIYIVGHTDMTGTFSHNLLLSKNRAHAVVEELINKYNIDKNRLSEDGVGPLSPIATNTNENGRKKNRRVELVSKF